MWFLLLVNIALQEAMILHAQDEKLILKGGTHACEGHVEIYHNGQWGYVGDESWSTATEEVVCRSTHCGTSVKGLEENVLRSRDKAVWLNEVSCSGTERRLLDCHIRGWNISVYRKDTVKWMQCSDKVTISLDGFQCAGAVKYSIEGSTRSGYFCDTNWGKNEADYLCKSLNCGSSKKIPKLQWMVWKDFQNSNKMKIKCSGIGKVEENLWQCASQELQSCPGKAASVICEHYQRLQLRGNQSNACSGQLEMEEEGQWKPAKDLNGSPDVWCKQMSCGTNRSHTPGTNGSRLECTDKVHVSLQDKEKPSKCYGAVYITVNGTSHPVCGSNWNKRAGELVCKELNCGKVISTEKRTISTRGIMDYVDCLGSESSLWHCWAKRDKTALSCESTAHVVCEDSIDVRLMDGPGECSGRVEIQHEGRWKVVSNKGWTDNNSNTVCRQLKCGKKRNITTPEKVRGLDNFLTKTVTCKSDSSNISQCLTDKVDNSNSDYRDGDAVGITCEEHKVVFLHGSASCSGLVGIEHGSKTYWLSGSNETWNQDTANAVCQQMHCGNASSFSSIHYPDMALNVWDKSLNCSPQSKSVFECKTSTVSPDANSTVANVTCSGSITVNLSNGCWGYVDVYMHGWKGGVCANTWTEQQSVMLCKNLGCGDKTLAATSQRERRNVLIKSLHATRNTTKLSQCNFVKNDDNSCNDAAYVVCSGSVKPRFSISRDKCSGKVEMLYEGTWRSVCSEALQDVATQNALCKQLQCGQAVKNTDYFGPKAKDQKVISKVECSGTDAKPCNVTPSTKTCTHANLECSDQRKITLSNTCAGEVYLHTDGKTSHVSSHGWTEVEGRRLCQDLQCGDVASVKNRSTSQEYVFWNGTFSCAGVEHPENIWACEKESKPTEMKQLIIDCKEKPKIAQLENCHGRVKIDDTEVCSTHWDHRYSHLVCHEQKCSNAIVGVSMSGQPKQNAEYYHVSCDDNHHRLGQCKRVKGTCDGKLVSVYCVNNVEFNTTGMCGGQILVKYSKEWENVCPLNLSTKFKNKLCQQLGCDDHIETVKSKNGQQSTKAPTIAVECTEDHEDIRHCVQAKPCREVQAVDIYCKKYAVPPVIPTASPPNIVHISLGVGIFVIVVMVIIILVRVWIVRRARKDLSRMWSQREEEFESGEFENIKDNEMEDFGRDRFRSEVIMEPDARSISLPYDDVDEVAETQPLTSEAAADQSTDGVAYEVDDPQESYDDIEASPGVTQTAAEVHDSPRTTPESGAGAPPDLVPGEDDYLVPGQDV